MKVAMSVTTMPSLKDYAGRHLFDCTTGSGRREVSTSFYALGSGIRIGTRSAAGLYCWDCRRTLCLDGEDGIHHSGSSWAKSCPACGQLPAGEGLLQSAAGRELGFNDMPIGTAKHGVASCSSFRWEINPSLLEEYIGVKDEYGRAYGRAEFVAVLAE